MGYQEQQDEWRKQTVFCVEADSFAHQMLWEQWHDRLRWEQMNPGTIFTVGHIGKRPVCVGASWARINGLLVMFWEATSEVVDYKMIERWFDANCAPRWDAGGRRARCNAMNFHLCAAALNERNGAHHPAPAAER